MSLILLSLFMLCFMLLHINFIKNNNKQENRNSKLISNKIKVRQ
jgi:hypothetical protein